MAKVLVASSNSSFPFDVWRHSTAFLLRHSAELAGSAEHCLTEDPEEADLILFGEMGTCGEFAEMVRAHPLYKRYSEKCFVFDSGDSILPSVPGVYASLSKDQYRLGYTRTGFYLYLIQNPFLNHRPCSGREKYLASFVGSKRTHPVREELFKFGRDDIYVRDTSNYGQQITYHGSSTERARFWAEYADSIADAKFSLCPRGRGTGSIRLFESMKMGRACVVLSDDWRPNDGVAWSEFSITVPEKEVHRIPEILEQHEHRAAEMGRLARQEWEKRFSEQTCFQYVVELCLDIQKHTRSNAWARTTRLFRQTADPKHFRRYMSSKMNLYRNTGKLYW